MKAARKTVRRPAGKAKGFSKEERAAMRERARELKAEAGAGADGSEGERDVLAKLAALPPADRLLGERVHAIIKAAAPTLTPTTWYGMPAYARDGRVVCFFQSGQKFKTRYATLGFSDKAHLDDGLMWPTSYALKDLTGAEEERIRTLLRKAVG